MFSMTKSRELDEEQRQDADVNKRYYLPLNTGRMKAICYYCEGCKFLPKIALLA